jgi:hypothetical protein
MIPSRPVGSPNRAKLVAERVDVKETKRGRYWLKKKPLRIARNGVFRPKKEVPVSSLKGFPTSTGLTSIGIGDLETPARQAVRKIDNRASNIVCAESINDHRNPVRLSG